MSSPGTIVTSTELRIMQVTHKLIATLKVCSQGKDFPTGMGLIRSFRQTVRFAFGSAPRSWSKGEVLLFGSSNLVYWPSHRVKPTITLCSLKPSTRTNGRLRPASPLKLLSNSCLNQGGAAHCGSAPSRGRGAVLLTPTSHGGVLRLLTEPQTPFAIETRMCHHPAPTEGKDAIIFCEVIHGPVAHHAVKRD